MPEEKRACKGCNGVGTTTRKAFEYEGRKYPEHVSICSSCDGNKFFVPLNKNAIETAIRGRKGLRTTAPKNDWRAYYVWRLARFHGGEDMTMPMTATLMSRNDPYLEDLNTMADEMAKKYFGSDMKAARRWGQAMYGDIQ